MNSLFIFSRVFMYVHIIRRKSLWFTFDFMLFEIIQSSTTRYVYKYIYIYMWIVRFNRTNIYIKYIFRANTYFHNYNTIAVIVVTSVTWHESRWNTSPRRELWNSSVCRRFYRVQRETRDGTRETGRGKRDETRDI